MVLKKQGMITPRHGGERVKMNHKHRHSKQITFQRP